MMLLIAYQHKLFTMKYPLMLLLALCIFQAANAQDRSAHSPIAVSAGFELGLPSQSIYSVGLGGSLKIEVPVARRFAVTATGGITSMDYKNAIAANFKTGGSDTFVPIKGGVKYYAGPGFYIEGELGTAIQTAHEQHSLFAFSIGPGFLVPISGGKSALDIGFRYESWSEHDLRQTGLRVGYRFGR